MAAPLSFAHLRDELDHAVAELDERLARAGNASDDTTTRSYREGIMIFNVARSFADAMAKQSNRCWRVEHGIIVLRLENPPKK